MPPKKARFGHRGKGGGKGGKGGRGLTVAMEVAATAGATITATVIHGHTGETTTMVTMTIGEFGVVHTNTHGIGEDEAHGAMAPESASNLRDRDRFITQMMEDKRYQYRKQNDPDFLGSGASASVPSSEDGKANENDKDAEFDAALEKRRNDRKK